MDITAEAWQVFLQRLRTVNNAARDKILFYLRDHPIRTDLDRQRLIEYAYLICTKYGEGAAALCCDEDIPLLKVKAVSLGKRADHSEHARRLFDCLRSFDGDSSVKTVYSRLPKTDGVELAVYNRLIRAAGFEVISLEKA